VHTLHPTIHGRCSCCGAVLLHEEVYSVQTGHKIKSPCCSDGKHVVNLAPLPEDLADLYQHPAWPELARQINHDCSFVTTGVVKPLRAGGKGFHQPAAPPCLLRLQGSVSHWLRPLHSEGLQSALQAAHEVRLRHDVLCEHIAL
jgi:hypothetical protein